MLDRLFHDSRVLARLRSGELGASLDDFAAHLLERGHSRQVAEKYVRGAGHFAHWLARVGKKLSSVDEGTVRVFCGRHLAHCRCEVPSREPLSHVRPALGHLVRLLRTQGHVADEVTYRRGPHAETGPHDETLAAFESYLQDICGVSASTRQNYLGSVRAFLRARYGHGDVDLSCLTAADIVAHVTARGAHAKSGTVKQIATALRGFLRCLRLRGRWTGPLPAIPKTPHWKLAHLPKLLSVQQVKALLAAFDRTTALGLRGYAVALCFVRLGLRTGEVVRLCLEDVDWRAGTLRIAGGKGRRERLLPLPADLGRAIVAYLRHGRPRTAQRALFVGQRTPLGPMPDDTIRNTIRGAWTRAGIEIPFSGTHVLRHTVATHLLRSGASLKEIADLLGHRSLDTTTIYAKVDLVSLSQVALPWPQARA